MNADFNNLDLNCSFGLAAQLSFDYMLDEKWWVNTSIHCIKLGSEANFVLNGAAGRIRECIVPLSIQLLLFEVL